MVPDRGGGGGAKSRHDAGILPPSVTLVKSTLQEAGLVPPPIKGSKLSWRSSFLQPMCDINVEPVRTIQVNALV